MKTTAQVINERAESFTGKRGRVDQKVLSLLDLDPDVSFLNTFDYVLSAEEGEKHSGKLNGKRIELGIQNFAAAFGGRFKAQGRILKVLA